MFVILSESNSPMGVDIVFSRSKDQKLRRMVMVDSECGITPRDSFIPRCLLRLELRARRSRMSWLGGEGERVTGGG